MSDRRAIIIHDVVLTTVRQSQGAPVIDKCFGRTQEGQSWKGFAIHLSPWRKDRYGDRLIGTAFCIGKLLLH